MYGILGNCQGSPVEFATFLQDGEPSLNDSPLFRRYFRWAAKPHAVIAAE